MSFEEKIGKVLELGQESTKASVKSTQTFFDVMASTNIEDDLDLLLYNRAKAYANADAQFTNKCRTTAQKMMREKIKAQKESK